MNPLTKRKGPRLGLMSGFRRKGPEAALATMNLFHWSLQVADTAAGEKPWQILLSTYPLPLFCGGKDLLG